MRIKEIRESKGISQRQVAIALGLSPVRYGRYENGQRKPEPEMLTSIAEYFGVTVDELIGRDDADTKKEPATAGGHDESSGSVHRAIGSYPECQWFESVRSH